MRTFDLTPLLRSTIGFDPAYRAFEASFNSDGAESAYPPYNIEKKDENEYQIAMAVAGFDRQDLEITVQDGVLIIAGKTGEEDKESTFLHRGIAARAFERRFRLADTIKVVGADIVNGMLTVDLVREIPEHKRPRQIEIGASTVNSKKIEQKAA